MNRIKILVNGILNLVVYPFKSALMVLHFVVLPTLLLSLVVGFGIITVPFVIIYKTGKFMVSGEWTDKNFAKPYQRVRYAFLWIMGMVWGYIPTPTKLTDVTNFNRMEFVDWRVWVDSPVEPIKPIVMNPTGVVSVKNKPEGETEKE